MPKRILTIAILCILAGLYSVWDSIRSSSGIIDLNLSVFLLPIGIGLLFRKMLALSILHFLNAVASIGLLILPLFVISDPHGLQIDWFGQKVTGMDALPHTLLFILIGLTLCTVFHRVLHSQKTLAYFDGSDFQRPDYAFHPRLAARRYPVLTSFLLLSVAATAFTFIYPPRQSYPGESHSIVENALSEDKLTEFCKDLEIEVGFSGSGSTNCMGEYTRYFSYYIPADNLQREKLHSQLTSHIHSIIIGYGGEITSEETTPDSFSCTYQRGSRQGSCQFTITPDSCPGYTHLLEFSIEEIY
ncbi:hypothetical protein Rhal01_02524 [Rubritalea halochordaticola]|uniref:Uncharacterized protein n=1 Tax=Rubritalea halochordaticola TaxID=714537 RepID=A0ABP9V5G5_9BACT